MMMRRRRRSVYMYVLRWWCVDDDELWEYVYMYVLRWWWWVWIHVYLRWWWVDDDDEYVYMYILRWWWVDDDDDEYVYMYVLWWWWFDPLHTTQCTCIQYNAHILYLNLVNETNFIFILYLQNNDNLNSFFKLIYNTFDKSFTFEYGF